MLSYYIFWLQSIIHAVAYSISKNNKIKSISPSLQDLNRKHLSRQYGKRVYKTIPFFQRIFCIWNRQEGSATVEAALILPLFIMAAVVFFWMGNLLQTRLIVYDAMQDTAQCLAEYQYAYSYVQDEKTVDLPGNGVNVLTVKERLQHYLDISPVDASCIVGGTGGILVTRSAYSEADGCIDLKLRYKLQINVPFFGELTWKVQEQIRQRAFIGMQLENNETEENRYVYITETGEVYHTSRTCYHIKLTIQQIPDGELSDRYLNLSPCERCAEGRTTDGTVYITETGDRYHLSVSCSGLKRTVMRVKQKNVGSIPPCSNCGNG